MTVAAETSRRKRSPSKPTRRSPQAPALLAWYDRHRRKLPWRAAPGERGDPYRVWLSEIMLQQTTVKAGAPHFTRLLAPWAALRPPPAAPLQDVAKLLARAGSYRHARHL